MVLLAAVWLENVRHVAGAMAVAGVVSGVGAALASRWWTRLFVADLRDGR